MNYKKVWKYVNRELKKVYFLRLSYGNNKEGFTCVVYANNGKRIERPAIPYDKAGKKLSRLYKLRELLIKMRGNNEM